MRIEMVLRRLGWMLSLGLVLGAGLLGSSARGDPVTAGGDEGSNSEDIGRYLGMLYKDEIAGIKIAPPVGSRIINRAGLDLVTFVNDAKQWGGNVMMVVPKEKMSVEDYLSAAVAQLGKTFSAVQVLDSREIMFQGHKAARLTTSMQGEAGGGQNNGRAEVLALYRQQLIVQMADMQFVVVTLYVPLKDREAATATFDAMLSTFELMDRDALAKQRAIGVRVGKEWLSQRTAEELTSKLNPQPQLFRMKVGGSDVGFMRFDEKETSRDNSRGIQVTVTSRSFPADGSNMVAQNLDYWAYAGDMPTDRRTNYSSWENTVEITPNRPGGAGGTGAQTFWSREVGTSQIEGISHFSPEELAELQKQREAMLKDKNLPADRIPRPIEVPVKQYHVHVSYEGDKAQAPQSPFDASISLEHPAVLPATLEYLWPRVVDLSKPSQMVFVVYSTAQKKLTFRTLSVIGKDHLVLNKQGVDCVRCLDEMDPSSTTMWVDLSGRILMMRTSDQSLLLPTTEEEMRRLWAGRLQPGR